MVYLYAQSADARAREGLEMRRILVAAEDIPEGTPVAQAETNLWFQSREINAEAVVDGALSSIDPIRDQAALVDIYAGEQILSDKFGSAEEASGLVPLTERNLAMTVSLGDPQRVVNFVTPGSSVAIFLTGPTREGEEGTSLLLDRVRVAGVGDSTSPPETPTGGQQAAQTPSALLTLDVTQAQAQKIIFAQTQGALYLGLVNAASSVDRGQQATTSGNLFD